MKTEYFKSTDVGAIERCGKLIRDQKIVAFPTETVYGLGASCLSDSAVGEIFAVKNRPQDNPLIAHVDGIEMAKTIVTEISKPALELMNTFWPGPLTIILPAKTNLSQKVTAGGNTVAVRCPSHPVAKALITAAGVPIVAPSANLSGKPSPTSFESTKEDLDGKVCAIIDGGNCQIGVESTVVLPESDESLRILRPGAITAQMLEKVFKNVILDKNILSPVDAGAKVLSPGMKHRHYAPKAPLTIVKGENDKVISFLRQKQMENAGILCYGDELAGPTVVKYGLDAREQNRNLFSALRKFDKMNVKEIYARPPQTDGVGLAGYNRLLRAAQFQILEV